MNTTDVHNKIKEMSARIMNPRPSIMITELAGELSMAKGQLMPFIAELKKLRLIQSGTASNTSEFVRLTLLGYTATR